MEKVLALVLSGFFCFVNSKTPKSRSINLALETVLKFDNNDLASDLKLINSLQTFLAKVKDAIKHPKPSFRRNSENDLKFYDHLQNIIVLLIYLDDENLENAAKIAVEEFKKYRYKGCKFFELMRNSKFRKIMTYDLEEIVEVPADELRIKLRKLFRTLKAKSNQAQIMLIELLNSLYDDKALLEAHNFTRNLKNYQTKSMHDYKELHNLLRYAIRHLIFDQYSKLNINDRIAIEDYLNEVLTPNIVTRRSSSKQNSPKKKLKMKRQINSSEVSGHQTDADLLEYIKWRKSLRRHKNRNGMIKKINTSKVLARNKATNKRQMGKKQGNKTHDYNAVINIGTFGKDRKSDNKISRRRKQGYRTIERDMQKQNDPVDESSKNIRKRNVFDFLSRNPIKQRRVNYDSLLDTSYEFEEGLAIESFEPITTNLTSNYKNDEFNGNQSKPEEIETSSQEVQDIQTNVFLDNHNDADFEGSNLSTKVDSHNTTHLESRPDKAIFRSIVEKFIPTERKETKKEEASIILSDIKLNSTVGTAITDDPSFEKSKTFIVTTSSPTRTYPPKASSGYSENMQGSLSGLTTKTAATSILFVENVTKDLNENTIETGYLVDARRQEEDDLIPTKQDMNIMLEENVNISSSDPTNQEEFTNVKNTNHSNEENNNTNLQNGYMTEKNTTIMKNDLKIKAINDAQKMEENKIALLEKRVESLKIAIDKVYEENERRYNRGVKLRTNDSESENKDSASVKEKTPKTQNDTKKRSDEIESTEGEDENEDIVITTNEDEEENNKSDDKISTTEVDDSNDDNEKTPNKSAFKQEDKDKGYVKIPGKLVTKDIKNEKLAPKLEANDNAKVKYTNKLVTKQKTTTNLKVIVIDYRNITTESEQIHSDDVKLTNDGNGEKIATELDGNNSDYEIKPTYLNSKDEDDETPELTENYNDDENTQSKIVARDIHDEKSATKLGDNDSDHKEITTQVTSTTKLDGNKSKQTSTEINDSKEDDNEETPAKLVDKDKDDVKIPMKFIAKEKDSEKSETKLEADNNENKNNTFKLITKERHKPKFGNKLKGKDINDGRKTTKAEHKHSDQVKLTTKLDSNDSNEENRTIELDSNNSDNENTPTYSNSKDEDGEKPELKRNDNDSESTQSKIVARCEYDKKSVLDNDSDDKEIRTTVDQKQNDDEKSTTKLDSNENIQTVTKLDDSKDANDEETPRKLVDKDKDDKTTDTNLDDYDGDDENTTSKQDNNDSSDEEMPTKLDANKTDEKETIPELDDNDSIDEETTIKLNSTDEKTTAKLNLSEELRDNPSEEPTINARSIPRTQDEIRAADPFGDISAEDFTKTTLSTIDDFFPDLSSSTKSLLKGDPLEDLYEARGIPL